MTALCIAGSVVVLAGCGSDGDDTGPAAGASTAAAKSKEKVKVAITVSTPSAHLLLPFLAEEKGLFEKEGLDATVATTPPPQDLQALTSGTTQVAVAGAPQFDLASAKAPIKIVGTWAPALIEAKFVVGPGIEKASDLKGKPVGVAPKGNQSWVLLQRWFQSQGMSIEDVKETGLPSATAIIAFQKGQLDGLTTSPPLTELALERKGSRIMHTFDEPWTSAEIVINGPWAEENPEAVQGVVNALNAAVKVWKSDPVAAKAVITERAGLKEGPMLERAYEATVEGFADGIVAISHEREGEILATVKAAGLDAPDPSTIPSFIDNSFVEALGKSQ